MKKKILVSSLVAGSLVASSSLSGLSTVFAESAQTSSAVTSEPSKQDPVSEEFEKQLEIYLKKKDKKTITFEQIEKDPLYKDLPVNKEKEKLYKEMETFKKENPGLSPQQIVNRFDFEANPSKHPRIADNDYYDRWKQLTTEEKILIALFPGNALITDYTQDKAFELTQEHMGKNGLGDPSDAFRHAIWNALMCRYIDKSWASLYATAHEAKSEEELNERAPDGHLEREHREMDLHNNQKGRECWGFWDSFLWVSNDDLVDRVKEKLESGELTWLHD